MVEITSRITRMGACSASVAFALVSATPAAFADEVAGQITASIDAGLDGPIADGEHLKLGDDAACSILLDDDAVVELCDRTSVVFERDPASNRRIVSLDGGEIRIVVEPRDFPERIEIHTPAAIATLLGTIAHVSVDSETGATTVSSAQSEVSVRSAEPAVRGTTVLKAGEQIIVEPGEAPPATPRRLDPREISELGGCLIDFHVAAADRDSRESGERLTDRLAAFDAESADLPAGSPPSDSPGGSPGDDAGDSLTGPEDVCVVTDCESRPIPVDGRALGSSAISSSVAN